MSHLSPQMTGLMYRTSYPEIPRFMPRLFGESIWPAKLLSASFLPFQTPNKEMNEITQLKDRVKQLEYEMEQKQRLFRFTSRVSKKLIWIGQMSDKEVQDAKELGIYIEDPTPWVGRSWTFDESTSMEKILLKCEDIDTQDFTAQFPENWTGDSTTILHKGESLKNQTSETCIIGMDGKPTFNIKDSVTDIIAYGIEPDREDISFYYESDEDDATLRDYMIRLDRLEKSNQITNEKFKMTMREAVKIEELATEVVNRIIDVQNSKIDMILSPNFVSYSKLNIIEKNSDVELNVPKAPATPVVCVRGDGGGQQISGIPIRIIPPRIKQQQINPMAGSSRKYTVGSKVPTLQNAKIKIWNDDARNNNKGTGGRLARRVKPINICYPTPIATTTPNPGKRLACPTVLAPPPPLVPKKYQGNIVPPNTIKGSFQKNVKYNSPNQ